MTQLNNDAWEQRLASAMSGLMDIANDVSLNQMSTEEVSGLAVRLTAYNMILDMYNKTMLANYLHSYNKQDEVAYKKVMQVQSTEDLFRILGLDPPARKKKKDEDPPDSQ